MKSWGLRAAPAMALLLCVLLGAPQLRAHATLLSTSPAPGARIERVPQHIELIFSERIESVFHSLQVLDAEGRELATGEVEVADGGETLRAPLSRLNADAPAGRYAVYWRVNSLDGHQVQGHFGFGVAADAPSEAELIAWRPIAKPAVPSWFFPLLKALSLLALATWLGAFGPHTLGAAALRTEAGQALHRKFLLGTGKLALAAGAGYLLIEFFALAGKTATFTGEPLSGVPAFKLLAAIVTGSSYGHWWALRVAAACALLIVTAVAARRGAGRLGTSATGWLLGGVMVASIAASGHAQAAAGNVLLAALMDGLHLAATLVWAGGLLHLALSVGHAAEAAYSDAAEAAYSDAAEAASDEDADAASDEDAAAAADWLGWLAPRFSRLAQVAMVVLILTGVYNTWLHMPNWPAFVTTNYGRTLLGKLFWVSLTLAVAFINWRKVLPALLRLRAQARGTAETVGAADAMKWAPRFPSLLQAEFAGCAVIFATVAMLTNMAPATADPAAGPRELRQTVGKTPSQVEVILRIDPGRFGANRVQIQLLDAAGQPLAGTRKVMLYLRMVDMEMGLTTLETAAQPEAGFVADALFNMSGRWKVSVEVTPALGDAFMVEYDVVIH